ncbi:MAG: hypothetical protein M5R42_10950 [Rhodocyclaceae bacterium]|nr:hypothetical protein [Rhodocyclaceae bacterium]
MQPGLSFEQAPPISVPFRFFLTAPLFGMAAGLLLLWQGPQAFVSRWTPVALALTHLLAVGFMLQAMCGALLQMLPVAAGANIWQPRRVTHLTHAGLTIGTLLPGGRLPRRNGAAVPHCRALHDDLSRRIRADRAHRAVPHASQGADHHFPAHRRIRADRDHRAGCDAGLRVRLAAGAPAHRNHPCPCGLGTGRLEHAAGGQRGLPGGADVPADAAVSRLVDAQLFRDPVLPAGGPGRSPGCRCSGLPACRLHWDAPLRCSP